ncbi:hypothetical protein SDC9_85947 [bioreactor metagenome]|uniref:PRTase-CE domain-containing protein n=1 Tax=bioreactor metagenome TaxID=1076179 RepID=A0A644ZNM3_9ZZZZ
MEIPYKKLTGTAIDSSSYIQKWLSQFCESDKVTAIQILKHLHFIPRDSFSLWLNDSLDHLDKNEKYALYAVRKFLYNKRIFWNSKGYPPTKPSQGQGSEDFISSLINEASRRQNDIFFDHPSIDVIQQQKIKTIILIDDATGSGSRLISYIKFMLTSQKLLSYLSLGRIRFKIFVFASNNVAEQNITKNLFRHQSRQRKVSFSEKFIFIAKYKYDVNDYASRWGNDWKKIIQLVDKTTKVTPKNERRGYGEVMSNIVFYHSVPNNIPKLLLGKQKNGRALFQSRLNGF